MNHRQKENMDKIVNVKRINGKTPAGGDYSEMWYFDDGQNVVPKEEATWGEILEFTKDGELIQSTILHIDKVKPQ